MLLERCEAHHLEKKHIFLPSHHPQIVQEFLVILTRYDQISISTTKREYSQVIIKFFEKWYSGIDFRLKSLANMLANFTEATFVNVHHVQMCTSVIEVCLYYIGLVLVLN